MIASTVTSLRDARTWDPVALTAAALSWPGRDTPLVRLRDVTSTLLAESWVERDVPVITPASLDPISGGIRKRSLKYRGAAYQVRDSGTGLRPGDVLVPMLPDLPLLLVGPEHVGSLVSSSFLALRAADEQLGPWIWAVLTSRSGRMFRTHIATGVASRATAKSALLDLEIPLPPLAEMARLRHRLDGVELTTRHEEEEARETWWRIADLSSGDWQIALVSPDPHALNAGVPLGELCREIARGYSMQPLEYHVEPGPELLPVTDIAVLGGRPTRRWTPVEPRTVVAEPGDIFVAAVGNRPHAVLATTTSAVDRNLFVLRLRERSAGPALVRYLNGQTGYGLRQVLLTGAYIPNMRKDMLARLPVPPEALEHTSSSEPQVSLDVRLEHALWD
ncbi:hypothetical protein F4553_001958 [Allocatelliglobosispora scoriae]|uniref:Restriction endonuclease subunit S n=1 Tax=Allocatelliglobosispora scoriae TaxID=643052 RepID=A0A841BN15_9ACTN|nr:hypothetical protein [Allocatelliglobosispora scoriae]MBB5868579.1 hypothetical protein [Allocatelliglobosispora scoriae]